MSDQTCRSCEQPVTWAVTVNRKSMPLDPDPTENGNIRLTGATVTSDNGRTGPECEVLGIGTLFDNDDGPRYVSHFATCPNSAGHRRR